MRVAFTVREVLVAFTFNVRVLTERVRSVISLLGGESGWLRPRAQTTKSEPICS